MTESLKKKPLISVSPCVAGELVRDGSGLCVECCAGEVGQVLGLIDDRDPSRRFDGYTDADATKKKVPILSLSIYLSLSLPSLFSFFMNSGWRPRNDEKDSLGGISFFIILFYARVSRDFGWFLFLLSCTLNVAHGLIFLHPLSLSSSHETSF